jgi:hypothetical protein
MSEGSDNGILICLHNEHSWAFVAKQSPLEAVERASIELRRVEPMQLQEAKHVSAGRTDAVYRETRTRVNTIPFQ